MLCETNVVPDKHDDVARAFLYLNVTSPTVPNTLLAGCVVRVFVH